MSDAGAVGLIADLRRTARAYRQALPGLLVWTAVAGTTDALEGWLDLPVHFGATAAWWASTVSVVAMADGATTLVAVRRGLGGAFGLWATWCLPQLALLAGTLAFVVPALVMLVDNGLITPAWVLDEAGPGRARALARTCRLRIGVLALVTYAVAAVGLVVGLLGVMVFTSLAAVPSPCQDALVTAVWVPASALPAAAMYVVYADVARRPHRP